MLAARAVKVYCTVKPIGALVATGVVTVNVYLLVALLTGSVVGRVQFQRSCVAVLWKLPACRAIVPGKDTRTPFRNTATSETVAPVKVRPVPEPSHPGCSRPW